MKRFAVITLALFAMVLGGCGDKPNKSSAQADKAETNERTFTVKGVVKGLDAADKTIKVQHEAIPGYMAAMTMPFNVKDTNEVKELQTGDTITFRLSVTSDSSWIDQITKTGGGTPQSEAPTRPSVRQVREVEPLKVGDALPNYRFTNELGQAVSLSEFKGKALALNFIFTRCPIPDFCPLMSKNFAAVHQQLTAMPNAPTNWHLLTVSFDPHFDTPDVLKSYARRYQYDPQRWSFVTGAMIDIDAITDQFNLPVYKQGESWDHKLRTAVIDAEGRVQKIFVSNQWKTEELVDELIKAAKPKAHDTAPATSPNP
ncbi:MAG: redoxin domain-containing protein [Verrucomicrobia bacterium]|nr:redoxin domain-containing protein [Verrucomicrobiota bacterium]